MDIGHFRRQQLVDGLQEDLQLLKEYEDKLRLADDPKEKARCRVEIDRLKRAITERDGELQQLTSAGGPISFPTEGRDSGGWSILVAAHVAAMVTASETPDPVILLGAGASHKSGIPLSGDLIERAAKRAYCRTLQREPDDPTVRRSDWFPWLEKNAWFSSQQSTEAQYHTALRNLLQPTEERRAFLHELSRSPIGASHGYRHLLQLMAGHRVRTILTTNFDTVLSDLSATVPNPRRVTLIRTPDNYRYFSTAPSHPQLVYLHGDAERYAERYVSGGHERLDESLVGQIIPVLRDHPVIVIGYRGSEPSVMRHLLFEHVQDTHCFRHGLYWCVLSSEYPEGLHPFVVELAEMVGSNFYFVLIDGFDSLMESISQAFQQSSVAVTVSTVSGVSPPATYDMQVLPQAKLDEFDWPEVQRRLITYCKQMRIPVPRTISREWLIDRMLIDGLARAVEPATLPTVGGYLLFSESPLRILPAARIEVHVSGEEPTVFSGNIWEQLRVIDLLEGEFNMPFRLKGRSSETVTPYPSLALKEIIVNALAHRRYDQGGDDGIVIRIEADHISVINPGGLHESVRRQLPPDVALEDVLGSRPIKGYRNPVIADFLYSSGDMDKRGSGLVDVKRLARQNGGDVRFHLAPDGAFFEVALYRRPETPDGITGVASSLVSAGEFTSNLLEVLHLPNAVWSDETEHRWVPDILRESRGTSLPTFVLYDERLYTFSNLSDLENPLRRFTKGSNLQSTALVEFANGVDGERRLVNLLNGALRNFVTKRGLIFDWKRKRAYFPRTDDGEHPKTYKARLRQATRTVVKTRISPVTNQVMYWEHQTLAFQFRRFGEAWALHLLPTYVFTSDGYRDELPGERGGPLATRRLSREYNIHVDSHLVFWTVILSDGESTITLEDAFGSRIVLSSTSATCVLRTLEPQAEGENEQTALSAEELDELEDQLPHLADEEGMVDDGAEA